MEYIQLYRNSEPWLHSYWKTATENKGGSIVAQPLFPPDEDPHENEVLKKVLKKFGTPPEKALELIEDLSKKYLKTDRQEELMTMIVLGCEEAFKETKDPTEAYRRIGMLMRHVEEVGAEHRVIIIEAIRTHATCMREHLELLRPRFGANTEDCRTFIVVRERFKNLTEQADRIIDRVLAQKIASAVAEVVKPDSTPL